MLLSLKNSTKRTNKVSKNVFHYWNLLWKTTIKKTLCYILMISKVFTQWIEWSNDQDLRQKLWKNQILDPKK